MRQVLAVTLMLAMLVTGIEGAIDLAATSLASGAHEMHQHHPQDAHATHEHLADDHFHEFSESGNHSGDHGDPHDHDDESHVHVCHCGAHAPPLPFSLSFASSPDHDATPAFRAFLNSAAGTPPLLQPPIV